MNRVSLAAGVGVAAATIAGCGSSPASSGAQGYSPTQLNFRSDGTPDLTGLTVHLGNSAGDATVGDTVVYITVQKLKQWGATADLTLGNGNNTELAVLSGQLQATASPLPTILNAGLNIFGNNQVHVDYLMVSKDISDLSQIKGKNIAVATTTSPDNYLLDGALSQVGLTRSDINIVLTGSNGNSVNQAIQGKVDVAFVHADALSKLQQSGNFTVLANSAKLQPWDADSYMAAQPSWLKANPATAEAIDLAWLSAAKVFDTNQQAWVTNAGAYTKGAETAADAAVAYAALAKAQPWPDDGSGMTKSTVQMNFTAAQSSGQIKGQGNRPISDWLDAAPFNAALQVFQQHPNAY